MKSIRSYRTFLSPIAAVGCLVALATACGGKTASNNSDVSTDKGAGGATNGGRSSTPDSSDPPSNVGSDVDGSAGENGRPGDGPGAGGRTTTDVPGGGPSGGTSSVLEPGLGPTSGGNTSTGGSGDGGSSVAPDPTPQGGASAVGGTTSSAGNNAGGDASEIGGAGGLTGQGGAAGGEGGAGVGGVGANEPETSGVVETLGDSCSVPAQLACAGNAHNVTLICGGDGRWEAFDVCDTGFVCDSREGSSTGTCQPQASECKGIVGAEGCYGLAVVKCDADGISFEEEVCDWCWEGTCIEPDDHPCPTPELYEAFYDCSGECGGAPCEFGGTTPIYPILEYDGSSLPIIIRLPPADDPIMTGACAGGAVPVEVRLNNVQTDVTAIVEQPWRLPPDYGCQNSGSYRFFNYSPIDGVVTIGLNTPDLSAPAVNLIIREVL